jgi:hypothetical protein
MMDDFIIKEVLFGGEDTSRRDYSSIIVNDYSTIMCRYTLKYNFYVPLFTIYLPAFLNESLDVSTL